MVNVRPARSFWHAAVTMRSRENRTVEDVAGFGYFVKGPRRMARDGKARGAITANRPPRSIFNRLLRALNIFSEFSRGEPGNHLMTVTVAGDFVTGIRRSPQQPWKVVCDPAKGKASGFDVVRAQ